MNRLRVGDTVQVISGKEKGKKGKVLRLLLDADKVIVEGLNKVTRHRKAPPNSGQSGQETREAPLASSKVMPIDPQTGKPTRVKIKVTEDGKKVRVAKSGAELVVEK